MPGLYKLLIMSPNDDQAGVQSLTGFHTGADLFVAADPPVRSKWGGRTDTAFTAAQNTEIANLRAANPGMSIDTAIQQLFLDVWQPAFTDTLFEVHMANGVGAQVPAQRLLDHVPPLTTSAT